MENINVNLIVLMFDQLIVYPWDTGSLGQETKGLQFKKKLIRGSNFFNSAFIRTAKKRNQGNNVGDYF